MKAWLPVILALTATLTRKTVRLSFPDPRKRDNFGRFLCKVFVGETDVGEWLLENGHAVKYRTVRR